MDNVFRKIEIHQFDDAYRIIVERTHWLQQKGVSQWNSVIPEDVIRRRQQDGRLFGYWVEGELCAVVSLLAQGTAGWTTAFEGRYLFLATLASSVQRKGGRVGRECVLAACAHAHDAGYERIYLDCVDNAGALPGFYAALGFIALERKTIPDGRAVVLMRRELARVPPPPSRS
ncbi:MAG: hypothetical protein A3K19_17360 [Lentisphaerae bacterium RIFOXYB12_FULL_65_16]|nr:MAG: hypothetical protein A3K18_09080 [Lentisphaerae bacterium RIFOXYA12_64_32]OGV85634.1 MAG: hypothetical protein A3K19_17360 [Lentisphaerae bacterium RIFOXYB12_FULL_65_16]